MEDYIMIETADWDEIEELIKDTAEWSLAFNDRG
jgi:hypothetical protein